MAIRNCWCTTTMTMSAWWLVEGLKAGADMLCVVTADDSSFRLTSAVDARLLDEIGAIGR